MGKLEIVCGPMFAGKSTALLRAILYAREFAKHGVLVAKPAYDTRYGQTRIANHEGHALDAVPISRWPDLSGVGLLVLDEIQFLEPPAFDGDAVEGVRSALLAGVDVIAGGLDMDWTGRSFPVTAALLGMASEVRKLKARCGICGHPAGHTFKLEPNGLKVELGAGRMYEPRCSTHWHTEGTAGDKARGWA